MPPTSPTPKPTGSWPVRRLLPHRCQRCPKPTEFPGSLCDACDDEVHRSGAWECLDHGFRKKINHPVL